GRLSREADLAEAREFGDNEQNRANRIALNEEMQALAAIDADHVRKFANTSRKLNQSKPITITILSLVGIFLAAIGIWLVIGRVLRPIERITAAMTALAAGAKEIPVPARDRSDEVGKPARALGG